jgi:hypothetical protein
MLVKILE